MYIGCQQKKQYGEIRILHIFGAIMILLCHFVQKEHLSMLGEVFITGVPLFLFISGFLAALNPSHSIYWLFKKAIRILTPYYIWIISALCLLFISNRNFVSLFQTVFLMLNLQGINYVFWRFDRYVGVIGLSHLWFLTEIMLCYSLVPLLDMILRRWKSLEEHWGYRPKTKKLFLKVENDDQLKIVCRTVCGETVRKLR